MKQFFVLITILLNATMAFASLDKIKALDEKLYYPQQLGLNDFVVDVELKGLTQKLKEQKIFGKISDVTFKLYWANGKSHVSVEGLGKGFQEVKEQLAKGVESLTFWIVPQPWENLFKTYQITEKEYGFKGKDLTGKNEIIEYDIKVNKSRDFIDAIEGKNGVEAYSKTFSYESISSPKKRNVISSIITSSVKNEVHFKSEINIKRSLSFGHYLPAKIEIISTVSGPKSKSMTQKDEFYFSDYKINTGEAMKYIYKGEAK